jgi:hypothetical protein
MSLSRLAPEPSLVLPARWLGARSGSARPAEDRFLRHGQWLSKIARFNGSNPGVAYSVAQHSVMGAEADLQRDRRRPAGGVLPAA